MLSKLIEGGRRILDQERMIRASGLFDENWYAETYGEVSGDADGLAHYLKSGAKKGFDPGPRFSTNAYLAENPDVRDAGTNPLVHYLRFGRHEGRQIRSFACRVCRIQRARKCVRVERVGDGLVAGQRQDHHVGPDPEVR